MPRFLSRRKIAIVVVSVTATISAFTPYWPLSIIVAIGILSVILNWLILRHTNQTAKLNPMRDIALYDGLIIGDIGAKDKMKCFFCHSENVLSITAPCRTLEASYRILQHVVSIIPSGGVCVIVDGGYKAKRPYSLFDIPYFNLVTRKELKVEDLISKSRFPLIYAPVQIVWGG